MKVKTKITVLSIASILLMSIFIKEVDASNLINFDFSKKIKTHTNIEKAPTDSAGVVDANLKVALNQELNKRDGTTRPDTQDITIQEMESFTGELNLFGKGIVDITGLEYAINIKKLNLTKNSIKNLEPLEKLINLNSLQLKGNGLSDISPLSNLTNLTFLNLENNQIEGDVDDLENLVNLTFLAISVNKINNIDGLKNMNKLDDLYLHYNNIEDISILSTKTTIKTLYLNNNNIRNVNALTNLKNLELLYLQNNNIEDLGPIKNLYIRDFDAENQNIQFPLKEGDIPITYSVYDEKGKKIEVPLYLDNEEYKGDFISDSGKFTGKVVYSKVIDVPDDNLRKALNERYLFQGAKDDITQGQMENLTEQIYLGGYNIKDITGLEYLTSINFLALNDNQISNLEPIGELTNLKILKIYNNKVSDIYPISKLINLEELNIFDNQINDISSLSNLSNLISLSLNNNNISDISSLSGLTKLKILYLSDNQIDDISPLSGLTDLKNLYLSDNQIDDISPLSGLIKLEVLYLNNNQIKDISVLENFTVMRGIFLKNNQISDITPLENLTNVTSLYLDINKIDEETLYVLKDIKVSELGLTNNNITDISFLGNYNYDYLYLQNNKISDLSYLDSLPNFKANNLSLRNNSITDISPLANKFGSLNVSNQRIVEDFMGIKNDELKKFFIKDIGEEKREIYMGEVKQGVHDYTGTWDNGKAIDEGNFSGTVMYTNYKYDTEAPDLKFDDNLSTPAQKPLSDDELQSLFNVSAIDFVEGDLTSDVVVDQSAVKYDVPGNYKVTFSVTDPTGNSISKDANLEVKTLYPTISADDIYTNIDSISGVDIDEFLLNNANISVGETTKKLNDVVVKSTNLSNDSKAGIYDVTFEVSNDFLQSTSTDIKVYVANDSDIIDDTNPYIFANDISVNIGNDIDNSLYGAVAFDKDDEDLTSSINYPTIDTSTVGKKLTKLSVSDKDGNNSEVSVNVDVIDNIKPVIVASDSSEIEVNSTLSSDEAKKLFNVSVSDNVDNLTIDDVSVDMSGVYLNTVGTYDIVFSVSDKSSNSITKTSKLNVIDSDVPVINSLDRIDIKAKNPLSDDELKSLFKVSASDNYDGDITSDIVVNQSKVNYDIPGVYDVVFSVVDSAGNRTDKKVFLKILSNEVPVLKGVEDIEVINGSDFNPMDGVSANDYEDGDISSDIEVYSKDLKDGLSTIYNYSVTDSDGNVVEVNRTVKYVSVPNNKPVINGVDNSNIFVGEDFDPMDGVSAIDKEDGDLSSSISLSGSINNKVSGDYTLTYIVVDSDNNIVSVDRIISVKDIVVSTNNKPIITGANDVKVKIGSDFDIMEGIVASDVEDGDLSNNIIVIRNELDMSIVGDYKIIYYVIDSDSNISNVSRTISVYDENKVNNKVDSNNKNNIDKENKTTIVKKLIETGKSSIYFMFVSVLLFLAYFIQIKKVNKIKI